MSQDTDNSDGKAGWYPGKFVGKAMRRNSSTTSSQMTNQTNGSFSATSSPQHSSSGVAHTPKVEPSKRGSTKPTSPDDTGIAEKSTIDNSQRIPLATVRVRILEVRFLTIKSAKLSIELDEMIAVNLVSDWTYPIVRDFELLNINSDIRLEFKGSGISPYGVVIIPVTSLLKFNGAPAPAKQSWREIYPYYDKALQDFPKSNLKFRSALGDLPGSAMAKPPVALGFVSFEAEVLLPNKLTNVLSFYLKPSFRQLDRVPPTSVSESDCSELQLAVNQAKLQRDIQRVKSALFRPPAAMEYFMSIPEIFVLILALAFLILSVSSYQVPLVVCLLVLFNGIVAMTQRNTPAVVWNEPGVFLVNGVASIPSSSSGSSAPLSSQSSDEVPTLSRTPLVGLGSNAMSTIQAIVRTNQSILFQIQSVAHKIEIARNLLTFADPRVSLIVFGYAFAFAVVSSLLIAILSLNTYLVALASTLLVLSASYEFLGEQAEGLSGNSKYVKISVKVGHIVNGIQNLLSKIPDELELQHRKICAAQIVKEGGAEMLDAAAAYQS